MTDTDHMTDPTAPLADLIALIQTPAIRHLVQEHLLRAPAAFWSAPASTSGKYHPAYAAGEGGLVRHTRAVAHITLHLCEMIDATATDRDLALAAALCHDSHKVLRPGEYTNFLHPVIAADEMRYIATTLGHEQYTAYAHTIANAIASHMGRWNSSPRHRKTLPLPDSCLAELVHTADYLASRKHLLPEA